MRKGTDISGMRYAESKHPLYHWVDVRGRAKLCDCGKFIVLAHKLGVLFGYRSYEHEHKRSNEYLIR